eukprot:g7769.t1
MEGERRASYYATHMMAGMVKVAAGRRQRPGVFATQPLGLQATGVILRRMTHGPWNHRPGLHSLRRSANTSYKKANRCPRHHLENMPGVKDRTKKRPSEVSSRHWPERLPPTSPPHHHQRPPWQLLELANLTRVTTGNANTTTMPDDATTPRFGRPSARPVMISSSSPPALDSETAASSYADGSGRRFSDLRPFKLSKKIKCMEDGCDSRPRYGYKGGKKPVYCATHRKTGMVDMRHPLCKEENCTRQPSFGMEGDRRASYCARHKMAGMVNVTSRRCQRPGCLCHPNFGFPGDRRASYCRLDGACVCPEQLDGMQGEGSATTAEFFQGLAQWRLSSSIFSGHEEGASEWLTWCNPPVAADVTSGASPSLPMSTTSVADASVSGSDLAGNRGSGVTSPSAPAGAALRSFLSFPRKLGGQVVTSAAWVGGM